MSGADMTAELAARIAALSAHRLSASAPALICQELRISFATDRSAIPSVVRSLLEFCDRFELLTSREQLRATVALEEALVNAVVHGNLEISSKLRDREDDQYEELIAQRMAQAPFCDRTVEVLVQSTDRDVVFVISDQGPGFDVASIPDPTLPACNCRPHGRGLLLMRNFMDQVIYNDTGNRVTLIKSRSRCD